MRAKSVSGIRYVSQKRSMAVRMLFTKASVVIIILAMIMILQTFVILICISFQMHLTNIAPLSLSFHHSFIWI